MPELTIEWHTRVDDRSCPICLDLDGKSWKYHTDKDPFPLVLSHPLYGVVWDCDADKPRTHGAGIHNCRCKVFWTITDIDLNAAISQVRSRVETIKAELETRQT
jgi:hypothetical protein